MPARPRGGLLSDLIERLHDDGIETIYHGNLTGVLGDYWSVEANVKARTLWAHRQCFDLLTNVCEEYEIGRASISDAGTCRIIPSLSCAVVSSTIICKRLMMSDLPQSCRRGVVGQGDQPPAKHLRMTVEPSFTATKTCFASDS